MRKLRLIILCIFEGGNSQIQLMHSRTYHVRYSAHTICDIYGVSFIEQQSLQNTKKDISVA